MGGAIAGFFTGGLTKQAPAKGLGDPQLLRKEAELLVDMKRKQEKRDARELEQFLDYCDRTRHLTKIGANKVPFGTLPMPVWQKAEELRGLPAPDFQVMSMLQQHMRVAQAVWRTDTWATRLLTRALNAKLKGLVTFQLGSRCPLGSIPHTTMSNPHRFVSVKVVFDTDESRLAAVERQQYGRAMVVMFRSLLGKIRAHIEECTPHQAVAEPVQIAISRDGPMIEMYAYTHVQMYDI